MLWDVVSPQKPCQGGRQGPGRCASWSTEVLGFNPQPQSHVYPQPSFPHANAPALISSTTMDPVPPRDYISLTAEKSPALKAQAKRPSGSKPKPNQLTSSPLRKAGAQHPN